MSDHGLISRRLTYTQPEQGYTGAEIAARRHAVLAEELGLLIDGATNYAIYMLDPTGRVTLWNRGAERIKGWSEAEIIGQEVAVFYPPDDVQAGKPGDDLARANKFGRIEEESWRVRKDGSEFLASVTITALRDENNALKGFGKVIRDITDQKAAEAALVRREHHLQSILATVPDAMIVMDERGTVASFSAAAEQLFGFAESEVAGRNVNMLMPASDRSPHDDHLSTYLQTGVRHIIGSIRNVTAMRRSGETFPIELAVGEVSIGGERIFTGFIRDVSARVESDQRLQELQSELVHISRVSAMGTMASTLAHEINQPLTAIANYLETAREMIGETSNEALGEIAEAIELAAAQSLRAGNIVRRLRAFVDGGETSFELEPLEVLVREAITLGLLGAREAGVTVTIDIADGLGHVRVDRIQIQQVIVNLIRNALHAMESTVCKELHIATEPDGPGWVRIAIRDTGGGIEPGVRARLFEAFATTKEDGMGLGLSICRTIVEAHGGRIWADAVQGGGTIFYFTIPLAGASDA
jgi:two-component system sensor kinase FixL